MLPLPSFFLSLNLKRVKKDNVKMYHLNDSKVFEPEMRLTLICLFVIIFGMLLSICFVLPSILFLKIVLLFVLRVLYHLAVFGGLPITWTWKFFWSGLFADIMVKSGLLYMGSDSSKMGFEGGVEGRSDIVTMDGNPQQGGPSTSTPHNTDGANQAPSEDDDSQEAPFDLNLPAEPEPASPSDPLEAENRRSREENAQLKRACAEELRRLKEEGLARLQEAERQIHDALAADADREKARAIERERRFDQFDSLEQRNFDLEMENEALRNTINRNEYEQDRIRRRFRHP